MATSDDENEMVRFSCVWLLSCFSSQCEKQPNTQMLLYLGATPCFYNLTTRRPKRAHDTQQSSTGSVVAGSDGVDPAVIPTPMLKKLGLGDGEDAPILVTEEEMAQVGLPVHFGKQKETVNVDAVLATRYRSKVGETNADSVVSGSFVMSKEEQIKLHTEVGYK